MFGNVTILRSIYTDSISARFLFLTSNEKNGAHMQRIETGKNSLWSVACLSFSIFHVFCSFVQRQSYVDPADSLNDCKFVFVCTFLYMFWRWLARSAQYSSRCFSTIFFLFRMFHIFALVFLWFVRYCFVWVHIFCCLFCTFVWNLAGNILMRHASCNR